LKADSFWILLLVLKDILAELIKKSGGFLGRGSKFGGLDIKRVYFGSFSLFTARFAYLCA